MTRSKDPYIGIVCLLHDQLKGNCDNLLNSSYFIIFTVKKSAVTVRNCIQHTTMDYTPSA